MKYFSGENIRLGDRLRLSGSPEGVVVCSIDTDEYTEDYPAKHWQYLGRGVLADIPGYGLIHFTKADADLDFIGRAPGA